MRIFSVLYSYDVRFHSLYLESSLFSQPLCSHIYPPLIVVALELDPMQKTKEGILFSTSQVCNSLETVILSGRYDAQRLLWLPVLFSHIARKVALRPNLRAVNIKTVVDSTNLNVLSTESGAEEANKVLSSLNMSLSLEPNAVVVHLDFSYNPMLFRDLALRAQQLLHRSNAQY